MPIVTLALNTTPEISLDEIINKQIGYDTYTFLLDFTNDKYVNAKDFAVLNKNI